MILRRKKHNESHVSKTILIFATLKLYRRLKKTQNILFPATLSIIVVLGVVLHQFRGYIPTTDIRSTAIAEAGDGNSTCYLVSSDIDDINAHQEGNLPPASPYDSEEKKKQEEKKKEDNKESEFDFLFEYFFSNAIARQNDSQTFSFTAELLTHSSTPLYILFHSWKSFLS
jgi:hypothetical protein